MDTVLTLASPAFSHNGIIPKKYTCDVPVRWQTWDRDISPPLSIRGAPEGTESFVLIMDDPDIPKAVKESLGIEVFDHWVLYNIPMSVTEIPESASTKTGYGIAGLNSSGSVGYVGPCPPLHHEPSEHRYIFSLYALGKMLRVKDVPTAHQIREALAPMVLARAELIGRYSRT
ncbi:MAG: YbhB/YbcL family Raf kinase inhibitor-like protein [Candidatus Paceibacterota bacterium]|jgi:hypothetical protein